MSRLYARAIVLLRYLMAPAWIGLTVLVLVVLPPLQSTSSRSGFSAILSPKSPAVRAQVEALHQFGFPLLAELAIVQHDPHGLPAATQANTVRRAVQLDLHQLHGFDDIAGAIPITNTLRLFPSARQRGTTAITYLFFRPSVGLGRQIDLTHAYSKAYLSGPGSGLIGATGPFLAQDEQGTQISNSLSAVELAVILLVLVVVGLVYRSVLAPLVTLVAAGCAYFVSERALALATVHLGITVPGELDPVIVVLLLGIMTDYSVFFLSAFRTRLGEGEPPRRAMVRAATDVVPLVLTAGITVAAGVAVLGAARLPLFAQLGPGLAITVAIGVLVALTFVPATLALLGALAYWPGSTWRRHRRRYRRDPGRQPAGASATRAPGLRVRLARLTARRWLAAPLLALGIAALVAGAWQLHGASIGVNLVQVLPPGTTAARAADAAAQGFAPGIVAPTAVLVDRAGVGRDRHALGRLQSLIGDQPGVAGVLGPADNLSRAELGAFLSSSGDAARYLVILDSPPSGAAAVGHLDALESKMGSLLRRSGLSGAKVGYAGETALSSEVVNGARGDLLRVGLYTLAIDFVILALFLRSLAAPLFLVTASALVVASALGITTWVFVDVLGREGFTFYVPFAADVLLISFGSDYNLFVVGRIWEAAGRMPPRDAIANAGSEAASAISVAGITLACSFAMLALVTLDSFRQLALAMFAGILIDTFIVRSVLVPATLSLLGKAAGWPGHRLRRQPSPAAPGLEPAPAGQADS